MKKTYIQPSIEMAQSLLNGMICSSQDSIASDNGIGYGGVDEEGSLEPASRRLNVWEEEETFEEDF